MRDHGLDIGVVGVGRGFGIGQHVFVVEDVEALVFHRPHVEVGYGDDVEHVEIVFAAERLLVPAHRTLERIHGVGGAVLLAVFDMDGELDLAARCGRESRRHRTQVAGHQREKIAGLGMGIVPDGVVPAIGQFARLDRIAVREQQRRASFGRLDGDAVDGKDVWPVEEIGDAPKPFGLALGAVDTVRPVEAHQPGIRLGRNGGFDFDRERAGLRQVAYRQPLRVRIETPRSSGSAVDTQREKLQRVAVENQRTFGIGTLPSLNDKLARDNGARWIQPECEVDRRYDEIGLPVVFEADFRLGGTGHGLPFGCLVRLPV